MNEPLVSVIVLNYNGIEVIESCIRSLLETDYRNFEVIIVDNASEDDSLAVAESILRQSKAKYMIIKNRKNEGYAKGFNIGSKFARGKYIVFANNDCKFSSEWLRELIWELEADDQVALVEGKIILGKNYITYPGNRLTTFGFYPYGFPELDKGQWDHIDEIFSPIGVCPVGRRSALEQVGYFDPIIFIQGEIEDLSWRLHLLGYKVKFVPKSRIYHQARLAKHTMSYGLETRLNATFHASKNYIYIFLKNLALKNLIKFIFVSTLMRFMELLYLMFLQNSGLIALTKVKAYVWILRNVRLIVNERRKVQSRRKMPDAVIFRKFYVPLNILRIFYVHSVTLKSIQQLLKICV